MKRISLPLLAAVAPYAQAFASKKSAPAEKNPKQLSTFDDEHPARFSLEAIGHETHARVQRDSLHVGTYTYPLNWEKALGKRFSLETSAGGEFSNKARWNLSRNGLRFGVESVQFAGSEIKLSGLNYEGIYGKLSCDLFAFVGIGHKLDGDFHYQRHQKVSARLYLEAGELFGGGLSLGAELNIAEVKATVTETKKLIEEAHEKYPGLMAFGAC